MRKLAGIFAIACMGFALSAKAQIDSPALRAKFGSPLNRETFHIPAGFDLVVDYGMTNQACKIELPALMPTNEQVWNAAMMKQRMYDFLSELAPASMRGKELQRFMEIMGAISLSLVEYEYVTIREFHASQPFDKGNKITVTFKNNGCPTVTRR